MSGQADPPISRPGDWRKRRRVIYGALIVTALYVEQVLLFPGDAVTAPIKGGIAMAAIGLATTVIVGYCGFAVLDDHNARKDGA